HMYVLRCAGAPPDLLSFPTRRSSDLRRGQSQRGGFRLSAANRHARKQPQSAGARQHVLGGRSVPVLGRDLVAGDEGGRAATGLSDRKSTRLNSSHVKISYAVFCLKKK